MRRIIFAALLLTTILVGGWLTWSVLPGTVQAAAIPLYVQAPAEKPIEGWTVCADLGVGTVPGQPSPRQRVRLCHESGWVVNTYCLRPDLPVPILGTTCTRTSEDSYFCGNGLQPLREYRIVETPVPTPTPTSTPILVTRAPTVTPVPSRRPAPGGDGYRDVILHFLDRFWQQINRKQLPEPTPTPFQPLHPTEVLPAEAAEAALVEVPPKNSNSDQIDLVNGGGRVQIRIDAPGRQINSGKPINLSFNAGNKCKFGDGRACVNTYTDELGSEVTFVTIHSGVGGEAQTLRHALEGTGFDQAALPLRQVRKNLQRIDGSPVIVTQGDRRLTNLKIAAVVRLPANQVMDYIRTPLNQALAYAAQVDPALQPFIHPTKPVIVLETCGWRMPGESNRDGLPSTSASIYIVVIQTQ